jgi:putative ABC transport system permease protein
LLYEWRRYLAAVIALAVAAVLVLSMTGMFMGVSKSFTATVDRSPAELMVLPPQAESLFSNNSGQPRRIIPKLYGHGSVEEVQALNFNFAFWSNFPKEGQTAKSEGVQIIIVDPLPGAVTLPNDFGDDLIQALREPYAVVVDQSSLNKLGVHIGDKAKINKLTVFVRAATNSYPSLFNSMVFMSRQTAKLLNLLNEGQRVGPLVVKIRDPARAQQVAAELNAMSDGQYKAWSRQDLSKSSQISMLKEGGISVMIGFAAVVGIFIGIVITWQTLQGAILANIKEFASLRALGVSMGSLRLIVLELSLWVGIAGLLLAAALTATIWVLGKNFGVPLDFPLFIDLPAAVSLLIVAVGSGALSLGVLKKSQPADLLR